MKTFHLQTKISLESLVSLEKRGLYEQALRELKDVWSDTDKAPNTTNYNPFESAEIILRCGSLIGFHGDNKQIRDAQGKSKNLLTEARQAFLALENIEKVAECENYLALAYWRTGELNEADAFVTEALSHELANSSRTRLYSHLIKTIIFNVFGNYEATTAKATELENDFRRYADDFLNGSFCTNVGIALKSLGRTAEALKKFELARYYHQKSRHQIYLGTVENNLAQLYKTEKQFGKAHEAADNATKTFKRVKDRTREGFSLDTKAQIYFAEGKYTEALQSIERGIEILKKSENSAYLSESFLTKAKILLYSDGFTAAVFALCEAVKIAEVNVGEAAAKKLIAEFEDVLAEKNKSTENSPGEKSNNKNLELILPSSLAPNVEIEAVRLNNDHFKNIGLTKNSVAVVAHVDVEPGDLVAVSENSTGEVVCGFFDSFCGIVCLETKSGEPYLFDENEVKLLGKIVGVARSEKTKEGRIIVEELNL